jgi:hypothetical protein
VAAAPTNCKLYNLYIPEVCMQSECQKKDLTAKGHHRAIDSMLLVKLHLYWLLYGHAAGSFNTTRLAAVGTC